MSSETTPAANHETNVEGEKKPAEPSTVTQGEAEATATDHTQISPNSVELKQDNDQQIMEEVNHATDQQPDSTTEQTLQTAEMHQTPGNLAEVTGAEANKVEMAEQDKNEAVEAVSGENQAESAAENTLQTAELHQTSACLAEVTDKAEVAGEEKGELHQAVLAEPVVMEPAVQVVKLGGSSESEDEQKAKAHEEKQEAREADLTAAVEEGAEKPKEITEASEEKADGAEITADEAAVVKTVVPPEVTIEEAEKTEGEVISAEQQAAKSPKVQGTQTPRTEVTSTEKLEESAKKRNLFGFHFGRSRSKPRQRSLDREEPRSFGANVKDAFGTLKRSIRIKKKPPKQQLTVEAKAPEIVVNVPPHTIDVQTPVLDEVQDQKSLHSISGTSISNPSVHAGVPLSMQSSRKQDPICKWTALSVVGSAGRYSDSDTDRAAVRETPTKPVSVKRGASDQNQFFGQFYSPESNASSPHMSSRAVHPPSATYSNRAPPRPQSPPDLSPVHYQPYHSEESIRREDAYVKRRNLMKSLSTGEHTNTNNYYSVTVQQQARQQARRLGHQSDIQTSGLREPPRPHTDYGVTGSLDRRYYGSFDTDTQAIVRRAQTLRTTDYASRLRERIRTFRPQTVESTATDGGLNLNVTDGRAEGEVSAVGGGLGVRGNVAGDTLKRQTLRPKQEVYVCSESFRIPHKLLKFKRRKTSPPKTVRSSGQEAAENVRPKYESSYDYDQDYSLEAQMEPAVFAKTEGYQHRVPPPVPRAPVQRPHISTNISVSGQPARQLTSLRSAASPTLLQQSTAIPDSASRGMLQMVSVGGDGCATESREVMLPYLSGELSDISKVDLLTGITVDEKVFEATCSDKGPILRDALSKVHPFMKLWMTEESQPETEQAETKEDEINNHRSLMHACLQDYLTACVRLRSVDLQGQYAPFHYPLVTFNERYWKKCAKLSGWGDLTVRCGPEWSTEYLRLPPVDPTRQTLVFPNVPVDTLLINWLNCHQAVVPTPAEPDLKGAMDTVAYHPVEIITTLDRLLEAYDKEKANTDLWHSCLRLAVLLSYNYCLIKYNINTEKHELDTKPANILVTLCTSNCLIIFHKRPANPPPVAKAETEQQSLSSPTADENARSKEKVEGGESGDQTSDTKAGSDKGTESGVKAEEGSPKEEAEVKAEEGEMTTAETKQVESEATETGEKGLLRKISPESKSVEEAIDHEIEKLYQAACSRFSTKNAPSYFFKAIAPPDWMAMVVARVCMKKE